MTTLQFNFMDPNIQAMFGNGYTSTIKHPSVRNSNINLDLFVDGLHDKLARIFCSIDRQGGKNITLPCPLTVEEDDLFGLLSKNQLTGTNNETILQHFKKYVTSKQSADCLK